LLIVHDSHTGLDVSKPAEVLRWQGRARGLLDIGYHLIIDRDGCIHRLRELDTIGSHTPGYNHESIGICLIGGRDESGKHHEDNFTAPQRTAVRLIALAFLKQFPEAKVVGHRELGRYRRTSKCPTLNVHTLRKSLKSRDVSRVRPLAALLARTEKAAS
jgi:N-acetyl-anhydromuramyl-L-alanine amidase AmpD